MDYIYDLIKLPSVNVILGRRGSGKSALAHTLLERLSFKYNLKVGIVGFPTEKKHLIPNTYEIFQNFNFPKNCIVFIDEVSFFAHARKSMSTMNTILDNIMARCRHMNWIIIVASHHSTKIDISLIRDADNIIFKYPSRLEVEYGSRTGILTNMAKKAKNAFNAILVDSQKYSYVFSEDNDMMVLNDLTSYWSEELSVTTVVPLNNLNTNYSKSEENCTKEDLDKYISKCKTEAVILKGNDLTCCICKKVTNILYSSVCDICFESWMLERKNKL
jgi:energy-coupling factor transporter ATP-binding protein EcfA2